MLNDFKIMQQLVFWRILFLVCIQASPIPASTLNENLLCENFYEYACAGWMHSHPKPNSEPFWSVFTETAQQISATLQAILEGDIFTNIDNEQHLYKACASSNVDSLKELQFLVNKLGGVQHVSPKTNRYDYLMHVIQVSKLLNIHPIIKLHVKQNMLHMERGDLIFPEVFLSQPERFSAELNIYVKWVESAFTLLSLENKQIPRVATVMHARKHAITFAALAKEVVAFEVSLSLLPYGKLRKINTRMVDKDMILDFLLGSALHSQVHEMFLDETYFDALNNLFLSTPRRQISNYIIWSVIKDMSRNVNEDLRRLSFEVDRHLIGVTADISRARECVDQTIDYMGSRKLLHKFLHVRRQKQEDIIREVTAMSNEIRNIFVARVQNNNFISRKTKMEILAKIEGVHLEILSPNNPLPYELEELTLGNNYFTNLITMKSRRFSNELKKLTWKSGNKSSHSYYVHWPSSIFEVNAFYSPAQNSIILPLGILQPPFFDTEQSAALNYGALGSLIGHEFSHVLDSVHRDELNISQNRNCNATAFSSTLTASDLAMNENIADFIGIRLSYSAMQNKFSNDMRADTNDELFFFSYAKMWCEVTGDVQKEILTQDEHAPVASRVNTTLASFANFLQTFNCASEPHYLVNQCIFWS